MLVFRDLVILLKGIIKRNKGKGEFIKETYNLSSL
jgi:hypothetical protein